jgi:membrane fusion protein, multidrug efflux system
MMPHRIATALCLTTLCMAVLIFSSGCGRDDDKTQPERPRLVRVDRVSAQGGVERRSFVGVAQAGAESKLSFKIGGTISDLKIKVGDQIAKGALIATLEGTDYGLQVQEAKASLDQAVAQERNARAQYDRVKSLYAANNASQQDLDSARTAYESARAGVAAVRKRVELAQTRAGYTRLDAPVAGKIAKVSVEKGENVQPGAVVAVLNSGARAEVEIAVPEILIEKLKEGSRAEVTFDAIKDMRFPGTVTEVGVASGGAMTTFPVTVRLDQEDKRIRSGMAAEAIVTVGDADSEPKLFVRPKAIGEDREGRFAFVAIPTSGGLGRVERKVVRVGEISGAGLEITSGLSEGDLLVTAGIPFLKDGQTVRMPTTATSASAGPASSEPPALGSAPAASAVQPAASN